MRRALVLSVLLGLGLAVPGAAQSLFATRGLGVPIQAVDGRARALGGVATGLFGFNPSMANPADVAGVLFRGGVATLQPSSRTAELAGKKGSVGSSRFPLIRVLYPMSRRLVLSAGFGGFLDQSWGVTTTHTELFGGDSVQAKDVVSSNGGISQLRVGGAYTVSPSVAIGVAGGMYTGNVAREVTRTFPDSVTFDLHGFDSRTQWAYSAPLASVGVRVDAGQLVRLGVSGTWAGRLRASTDSAATRTFGLPLQLEAGMSAVLSPRVLAAIGGGWAGWSSAAGDFRTAGVGADSPGQQTTARDVYHVGGGVEWGGARSSGGRTFPLRLGFNYTQFPFYVQGEKPGNEWSGSAGIGYRFAGNEDSPYAVGDFAIERGRRTGGPDATPLTENFWRLTISLALFGR